MKRIDAIRDRINNTLDEDTPGMMREDRAWLFARVSGLLSACRSSAGFCASFMDLGRAEDVEDACREAIAKLNEES